MKMRFKRLVLAGFVLSFLVGCNGVLEVDIERTPTSGEIATLTAEYLATESAFSSSLIATPTAWDRNTEATVMALETQNASLATQVAAQRALLETQYDLATRAALCTPDPIVTPTPTMTPYILPTESPPLPGVPSEFWDSVGVSPDTLVAVLANPDTTQVPRLGDIATMHVDGTNLNQITTYNYNADPVLSPDRQRIAYRSVPISITSLEDSAPRLNDGYFNIWVIAVDGTQAWQLTASEMVRSVPVWSPDSQKVAFVEGPDDVLVEVEVDTQTRREITSGASIPRYRPDGSGIGYVVDDGSLVWQGSDDSAFQTILPAEALPPDVPINDFEWLPDGQHVVYTLVDNREHLLLDPQSGRSVWITPIDGPDPTRWVDNAREVSVSPDGRTVALLQGSGFGDACFEDQSLSFLFLMPDFTLAYQVSIESFDGYPLLESPDSLSFHPRSNVTWVSDGLAIVQFQAWCGYASNVVGRYLIDPAGERMVHITRDE
jgi:hypothetical protein